MLPPWGPTAHWVQWFNAEFNEEIDIYDDGSGGPYDSNNGHRYLLSKRFIQGNINLVSCNTTFGDPTQFVLDRLREMAFRAAVGTASVADPLVLFGDAKLAQEGSSQMQNWTQHVDLAGERHLAVYTISIPISYALPSAAFLLLGPLYRSTGKQKVREQCLGRSIP